MSSIPVNNNLNVLANIVNQAVSAADSRNSLADQSQDSMKDSFDMVMNRVSTQSGSQTNAQSSKLTNSIDGKTMSVNVAAADSSKSSSLGSKLQSSQNSVENSNNTANQADKNVSDKSVSDNNISNAEKDALNEAGEKLVEDVAEEMGVDVEDVEEAMEILGLSMVQLLDPENMKQLLITLSGNEDSLAILTDGDLYAHLQNMMDVLGNALEDLGIQLGLSEEDLSALIADMAVVEAETEPETLAEELLTQSDEEPEVNLEGMKDYAVTVHRDGETIEVKVKVDDVSGEQTSKEEVTAATETQAKTENKSDGKDLSGDSKDENKGEANTAGSFVMQNPIENPNVNEVPQQPFMERYVSTEDIMNQILESMKINLKGDVQELELHLHPASLGNVHVQIAAREGSLTAQFIAQNETVKAAIESQIVQLKEQFEEQGIKVDKVEVAVGDYHFEHSFSGNEENANEEAAGGKKARRNINLNELDLEELPEDMDDSERIAAEMMAQSGNMVDYTA